MLLSSLRIVTLTSMFLLCISVSVEAGKGPAIDPANIPTELRLGPDDAQVGETVDWSVQSAGATEASSTNYNHLGTFGQTATDESSSDNFRIRHGFWQDFGSGVDCVPGDADGSGAVDIDDVVYLIAYIFSGGAPPVDIC